MRILLALMLSLSAPAAEPFMFLQMSDPQFGMYTENREFAQETANFEFAIATANRLRPAFVVVCGDLVNEVGNASQIAEYFRIVARLDKSIPLHSVAGNHDVGNVPTPETLRAYRAKFGPDYYVFRVAGQDDFVGIVLNSSLVQHPEQASDEAGKQERWLTAELENASGKRVVIFQHIPWFLERADEADQYFNIPSATRARYLALFERFGVHHVFAGHYHRNASGRTSSLEMTTTGPVGKPLGTESSGIRVVRVGADGISSTYYGLGNLPNR